jgi:hypothetical protein
MEISKNKTRKVKTYGRGCVRVYADIQLMEYGRA